MVKKVSKKNAWSEKFLVKKMFGQKIFHQRKVLLSENFGQRKNCGQRKILVSRKFWSAKSFGQQKNFCQQKFLVSGNYWSAKICGP